MFLFLGLSLQIFCFLNFSIGWTSIFYYFAFSLAGFWATIANHMHQHHPIFRSQGLNQISNALLSLMFGAPATRLHAVHLWNHHAKFNSSQFEQADWSHPNLAGKHSGFLRSLVYVTRASVQLAKNRKNLQLPSSVKKALSFERAFLWTVSAFLLWYRPTPFLGLVVPCWIISLSVLLTANLINHDGCESQSEKNHSRDFLHQTENWVFLNSGYHSAHHESPSCHWSQLPAIDQTHFSKKTAFREQSFFYFLWCNYILPGEGWRK